VLSPEATVLLLEGSQLAMAGEGVFALGLAGVRPVAEEVLTEAEGASRLGDGVALLRDELNGRRLELGGVGTSRSRHCWTSRGDCTPLTGCPPFVGKSRLEPERFPKSPFAALLLLFIYRII
jgi:hypothetical protein